MKIIYKIALKCIYLGIITNDMAYHITLMTVNCILSEVLSFFPSQKLINF